MMISTYKNETFWSFHPHFSTILRPFGVPAHVESFVYLTKQTNESDINPHGFAIFALWQAIASGAICRELRGVRIYTRVLSTTFATGEYIAVSQHETISRSRSEHIAHRRCISRERSELKGD